VTRGNGNGRLLGWLAFVGFVACVWLANATLERYGIVNVFGLDVPAGVVWAGLAFSLRDLLRERLGGWWMLPAIALGAALSWWVSDGVTLPGGHVSLALASGTAFLLSEAADALVYEPLRTRGRGWALAASNAVGSVVDSALFLWLAFGSLAALMGQVVVKWLLILPALGALGAWRWWRGRAAEARPAYAT